MTATCWAWVAIPYRCGTHPVGMYYHRNCRFQGGVDFVCPRGWCFVRDCQFESTSRSAALWHDGHMDLDMKFVLRNCTFDGPPDFWLGRNHYPSQFYLLDCQFSANLADKPIGVVKDLNGIANPEVYERKYFNNCHREGGDYAWHADNLATAADSPSAEDITPAWTFAGRWDPECPHGPSIIEVEIAVMRYTSTLANVLPVPIRCSRSCRWFECRATTGTEPIGCYFAVEVLIRRHADWTPERI